MIVIRNFLSLFTPSQGFYCLSLMMSSHVYSQQLHANEPHQWASWKKNSEIEVFHRKNNANNLLEIKATMALNSSLSGLLLFLQDSPNTPLWLENLNTSTVITEFSKNDIIFHNQFKGFWPIKARELIARSVYKQNQDMSIDITLEDMSDYLPVSKSHRRMKLVQAHWHIHPRASTTSNDKSNSTQALRVLDVTYTVIIDGQGELPYWLYRRLSLNGVWKSMNNLKRQLPQSKWQQPEFQLTHIVDNR